MSVRFTLGSEKTRLRCILIWRLQAKVAIGGSRCGAPARGTHQESGLDQERLYHVLQGAAVFANCCRKAVDAYRPTMYDFLVFNALQFYSSGEQAGAKAQDAFELSAEDPVFDSEAKFIAWQIKTTDTESRTVKALKLYQDLL